MNVDDIEEAFEELKKEGCTIVAGPVDNNNGRALLIKDNNGIDITLIEHR